MASPRPTTRKRRRRFVFILAAALLLFVLAELASSAVWWLGTGSFFSYSGAATLRDAARAGRDRLPGETEEEAAARRALAGADARHPYLGYVYAYHGTLPDGTTPVNRFGFLDSADTVRRRSPDRYLVGVTGGSVAVQMTLYAPEAFFAELGKCSKLAGRKIEFVRLALGGYKQPQGVAALVYVLQAGGELDCVVNLDGFNELALSAGNVAQGVPGYFPQNWARLAASSLPLEMQGLIGRLLHLRDLRAYAARVGDAFAWTATGQVLWLACDRWLGKSVAAASTAVENYKPTTLPYDVKGPGTGGASVEEGLEEMAGVWARSSQLMHAICAGAGIPYFHFLQPNQYYPGSKPMGDEERAVAFLEDHPWRGFIERGYALLERRFAELRERGVAFHDLRHLFADHPEPLYNDPCCHLNRRGNEVLATAVASVIRRHLELEGTNLAALRTEPAELVIGDPTRPAPLRVIGRTDDGRELDVTGVTGTELTAEDGTLIAVDVSGQVRALRRGTTALHVRCGGRDVSVPVRCAWPQVFAGRDGVAARDGRLPVLTPLGADAGNGGGTFRLRVEAGPDGLPGTLVVSAQPIPQVFPIDPRFLGDGIHVPLQPVGGSATVEVPLPAGARDAMLFFRAVFIDVAQLRIAAASNSVVVTLE